MTKKLLAIFLAISMALSFSACGGEKNSDSSTAEVTTTTTSETTAEMKTIEPPADGWTPELLNQVMYLNGKPFSLPCTLKDLGEEYSFSKDVSDWNDGTGSCDLLYNKEIVACVSINKYSDSKGVSDNSQIIDITFAKWMMDKVNKGFDVKKCSINGVFLDSTKEEVIQQLGDSYDNERSNNGGYTYKYKNTNNTAISFTIFDEKNSDANCIIIKSELCN